MPLSPTAQVFVNLARERDRAELQHACVRYAGPSGIQMVQPNRLLKYLDHESAHRLVETLI